MATTCVHEYWTVGVNKNDTRRLIECAKCKHTYVNRRKRSGVWVRVSEPKGA